MNAHLLSIITIAIGAMVLLVGIVYLIQLCCLGNGLCQPGTKRSDDDREEFFSGDHGIAFHSGIPILKQGGKGPFSIELDIIQGQKKKRHLSTKESAKLQQETGRYLKTQAKPNSSSIQDGEQHEPQDLVLIRHGKPTLGTKDHDSDVYFLAGVPFSADSASVKRGSKLAELTQKLTQKLQKLTSNATVREKGSSFTPQDDDDDQRKLLKSRQVRTTPVAGMKSLKQLSRQSKLVSTVEKSVVENRHSSDKYAMCLIFQKFDRDTHYKELHPRNIVQALQRGGLGCRVSCNDQYGNYALAIHCPDALIRKLSATENIKYWKENQFTFIEERITFCLKEEIFKLPDDWEGVEVTLAKLRDSERTALEEYFATS